MRPLEVEPFRNSFLAESLAGQVEDLAHDSGFCWINRDHPVADREIEPTVRNPCAAGSCNWLGSVAMRFGRLWPFEPFKNRPSSPRFVVFQEVIEVQLVDETFDAHAHLRRVIALLSTPIGNRDRPGRRKSGGVLIIASVSPTLLGRAGRSWSTTIASNGAGFVEG